MLTLLQQQQQQRVDVGMGVKMSHRIDFMIDCTLIFLAAFSSNQMTSGATHLTAVGALQPFVTIKAAAATCFFFMFLLALEAEQRTHSTKGTHQVWLSEAELPVLRM